MAARQRAGSTEATAERRRRVRPLSTSFSLYSLSLPLKREEKKRQKRRRNQCPFRFHLSLSLLSLSLSLFSPHCLYCALPCLTSFGRASNPSLCLVHPTLFKPSSSLALSLSRAFAHSPCFPTPFSPPAPRAAKAPAAARARGGKQPWRPRRSVTGRGWRQSGQRAAAGVVAAASAAVAARERCNNAHERAARRQPLASAAASAGGTQPLLCLAARDALLDSRRADVSFLPPRRRPSSSTCGSFASARTRRFSFGRERCPRQSPAPSRSSPRAIACSFSPPSRYGHGPAVAASAPPWQRAHRLQCSALNARSARRAIGLIGRA